MTRLELLVNEIATLSNNSLIEVARILVKDYPTRADVLETQIAVAFQDTHTREFA
jgi:hypothetical protein